MSRETQIQSAKDDMELITDLLEGGRYTITDMNTMRTMCISTDLDDGGYAVYESGNSSEALIETPIAIDAIRVLQNFLCKNCLNDETSINRVTLLCEECSK